MQSPIHILFVDDDPIFSEYFETVSKPYNVSLEMVPTFEAGKRLIHDKTYDAYVIDANLPDGSGFDLAEMVRKKQGEKAPIAVISGVFRDSDSFRLLKEKLKIDYVIDKPIPIEEIQALFYKLCQHKTEEKAFDNKMVALHEKYNKMIPGILKELEEHIREVKRNPTKEAITALKQNVHKIAGSAGAVGYPEVSTLCKGFELELIKHLEDMQTHPEHTKWVTDLDEYLRHIKFEYQMPQERAEEDKVLAATETRESTYRLPLYVVDNDRLLLTALEKEQSLSEIDVVSDWDPKVALDNLAEPDFNPRIVVVGEKFRGSDIRGKDIIDAVRNKPGYLPTTFGLILEKEDLKTRTEALKDGITYILKKPISAELFLNALKSDLSYTEHPGFKVLVIDDEPFTCEFISNALSDLGMEVKTLDSGVDLYEVVQNFTPNIIILDIYLPEYNGVELLKTLRSDIRYQNMLVVIITVSQDVGLLKDAYAVNVDDIIHKPLDKKILQSRISSLAKRYSYQGQFQNIDEATGLPNEHALHIHLHELLLAPEHLREGIFLALFEIDRFKEIAVHSSQAVSHTILSQFSNLMLKLITEYGYSASLGKGKFAVISKQTDLEVFKQELETLFEKAKENISLPPTMQHEMTFSAGIANLPIHYGPIDTVLKSAEKALAEAKQLGTALPYKIVAHTLDVATLKHRQVILVDGDKDLQHILKTNFESHGISVSTYDLGETFLHDILIKHNHMPPLIIMERLLPDMDGVDVLKRIHQKFPVQIPIIFLTTLSSDKDVFDGLKAGALDYITKPFNMRQLVQKSLGILART